jgi:hypothetical protein
MRIKEFIRQKSTMELARKYVEQGIVRRRF